MSMESHKGQVLPLKNKAIPIDSTTSFLAHYDLGLSDVLKGIEPIEAIASLTREGYYGKALMIEEGTTNLASNIIPKISGRLGYVVSQQSNVFFPEFGAYDATKITITGGESSGTTIATANTIVSNTVNKDRTFITTAKIKNTGSIQVGFTHNFGQYIWLQPGEAKAMTLSATANGVSHYMFNTAVNSIGSSAEYVICDLQVEERSFATSYTKVDRGAGIVTYPIECLNEREGTFSFWAKLPYSLPMKTSEYKYLYMTTSSKGYGAANSLNFWAQNHAYSDRIIGLHWANIDGTNNHIAISSSQVTNYNNGGWNMYTITWKNPDGGYKFYLNGELIDTKGKGKPLIPFDAKTFTLQGMTIDELRIDKVERKQDEILAWYYCNSPFWPKGIYKAGY